MRGCAPPVEDDIVGGERLWHEAQEGEVSVRWPHSPLSLPRLMLLLLFRGCNNDKASG